MWLLEKEIEAIVFPVALLKLVSPVLPTRQADPRIGMSDVCEQSGLELADFSPQITERVHELPSHLATRSNHIGMGLEDVF